MKRRPGMREEVEARFARDVAGHEMRVLRDAGVDRHLFFRRPEHTNYWFEVLTWSNALCIRGDMGCFVFTRIEDMFEFFRDERGQGRINPGYWAEKCVSAERHRGITEFSPDRFREGAVHYFRNWWRDGFWRDGDYELRRECFKDLRSEVLEVEDPHLAMSRLYEYRFDLGHRREFVFQDFEFTTDDHTLAFLWCLKAIVWSIAQFDEMKDASVAAEAEPAHG